MLKNIFILSLLFNSTIANAYSCISDEEHNRVINGLPSKGDFYSDVPNMADCKVKSELNSLVCSDSKLKDAMLLLSIGFIYAYENATHTPVTDYSNYNNDFRDRLNNIIKQEKNKDIALRKICYITKLETWNSFGDGEYYDPILIDEVISSKSNNNGVVINSWRIPEIYLGKSCDASNSIKEKGRWYKDKEQFVVELGNSKYRFNYDEKVFSL
ncbi:hypothetical protein HYE55_03840, partial [Aggregatibacter actinomycetemcomitans]|uniref:hypothetical protein n=2 Tax=Aggregatibacter actinomycetemcomitans TaxID=714 RepID=UPI00197B5FCA